MLVRPLINRELLRECRRKTHFVARTVFVIALGLFLTWRWMEIGAYGQQSMQALMARYGTSLFIGWAMVQYIAIWALSTIRAASLADERRIGSLQLMRATALQDRGVIVGWFLSVMGRALFTMALALPVLVMSRSFGGFTMSQVWVVLVITIVSAAASTAFTLCIAAMSNSTGAALISSVVLQALFFVGSRFFRFGFQPSFVALDAFSMLSLSIRQMSFALNCLPIFMGVRFVMTLLWLLLAIGLLKRPPARFGRSLKRMMVAADRYFIKRSSRRTILWRSGLGECKRNPILWRERAVSVLGQRDHVIRVWYTPVIALIVITFITLGLADQEAALVVLVTGLVGIPILLSALFLVVPPAMAFLRERQQGTLGLLAATPLSARDIVLGKYFFCLRRFTVPLALGVLVVGVAIMGLGSVRDVEEMLPVLFLPLFVPLFLAEMLFVTEGARSTATAIIAAAATLAGVLLLASPGLVDEVFWSMGDLFELPVVVYLPASAFAVAAALLAKRVRVMRNGLFIGGVALGLFIAMGTAHDTMRYRPDNRLVLAGGWIISAVVLVILVAAVDRRRFRKWVGCAFVLALAFGAILWVKDFSLIRDEVGLGLPVLNIALFIALLRAMRFAGPGVVNRAVLTIMLHWLVIGWASTLGMWLPEMWVLIVPAVAVMSYIFLKMSSIHLDPIMGRNG